jgi:hypothetical protein
MRIVDRKTFLAMPAGTLYFKYAPCYFEDFAIKARTVISPSTGEMIDWWYQDLDSSATPEGVDYIGWVSNQIDAGNAVPLDFNTEDRDGFFDQDQLFAVWDEAEVQALIDRLVAAKTAAFDPGLIAAVTSSDAPEFMHDGMVWLDTSDPSEPVLRKWHAESQSWSPPRDDSDD